MIANSQQRRRSTFETNILKFFFSKGHLLLIFVVLQIKIIHIYLSMSRMIDRVFYNPVENYSCGHPLYPSEISTLQPPQPIGISIDHPWGGGVWIFSGITQWSRTTLSTNLCRGKRSFKPYQNEHNSVKDTGERSKKPRDIDLKISMKILFHCSPTFPFT